MENLIEQRVAVVTTGGGLVSAAAAKAATATIPIVFNIGNDPVSSGLVESMNAVVPHHLSRDHRDDVIGEMALAVYEGRLEETDLGRRVREFVNAGYRRDHDPWGDVSLDTPIPGTDLLRINTVSEGLWG